MKYLRYYFADIISFLFLAALLILVIRYIRCKRSNSFLLKKEILYFVFYIYLTALLLKTVVPASYLAFDFSSIGYMLPDKSYIYNNPYQSTIYIRAYIAEKRWFELFDVFIVNLLMLIPFGFIFPQLYPKHQSETVIIGIALSCAIEFIQLFLPRLTDTYDIFLNAISVINGYLLYLLLKKLVHHKANPPE